MTNESPRPLISDTESWFKPESEGAFGFYIRTFLHSVTQLTQLLPLPSDGGFSFSF